MEEVRTDGMPYRKTSQLTQNLGVSKLSSGAVDLIYNSWRKQTAAKYETQINKFLIFCVDRNISAIDATINHGIEFLTYLFEKKGRGYLYINGARSTLSSFINCGAVSFGKQFLVTKVMRGIFNLRPSLPRYASVWNVKTVLDYLVTSYTHEMSLADLTYRTAILLCMTTGQRKQTIKFLCRKTLVIDKDFLMLYVPEILKTTKPGKHLEPIIIKRYTDNKICVVHHLESYLERTSILTDRNQVFLSVRKPFQPVKASTIAKWVLRIMDRAGINIQVFGAHSTRAAATSHAKQCGVSFRQIAKAANWASAKTFATYYDKPIERTLSDAIYDC